MTLNPQDLAPVSRLFEEGKCFTAYKASLQFGPLRDWGGPDAMVLAGRIAYQVGSPRLSDALHLRVGRLYPDHFDAMRFHTYSVLHLRGAVVAWGCLDRLARLATSRKERRDLLSVQTVILASLRDFERAEASHAQAVELADDDPALWVDLSFLRRMADRRDEALVAARRALSIEPGNRLALLEAANLLLLAGRDDEAIELLQRGITLCESARLPALLVGILTEKQRYSEAEEMLELFRALSPLCERALSQWILRRKADLLYHRGDLAGAREAALAAGGFYSQQMAERLASPPVGARRLQLPVPLVRQDHLTCAPATISALSRYWTMPVEHGTLVEQICYDGTPSHKERIWLEENGWLARDFTLSGETARALIDRGVPFTLSTVEADSAHLQAVVGYDTTLDLLLVRDPSSSYITEFLLEPTLDRYGGTGPLCRALVPRNKSELLDGLDLPEAPLHDLYHKILCAVDLHRRDEAQSALESLVALAPAHRITWFARRSLAVYDGDSAAILHANEELWRLFPGKEALARNLLLSLRELRGSKERLELLEPLCAQQGATPYFQVELARELLPNPAERPRVRALLSRAIAHQGPNAGTLLLCADLWWEEGCYSKALEIYRFAACADDKDERAAEAYFKAARYLKKTDEVLAFLVDRHERYRAKSSGPSRTLVWALRQLDRIGEALQRLEEGFLARPLDGELLLYGARVYSGYGLQENAHGCLERARGNCARPTWLDVAAELARERGDLQEARELWRQVLEAVPTWTSVHREYASALAQTEGREAAIEHLRKSIERYPHNVGLKVQLIRSLKGNDPAGAEQVVAALIASDPHDAWARRERAYLLERLQRPDEALEEAQAALRLEPRSASSHGILGSVQENRGEQAEARRSFREAIALSADYDFAIRGLLRCSGSSGERREALHFVRGELERQTLFESGVLVFRSEAVGILSPEEILECLRLAHATRPDLWSAATALIQQLKDMGRMEEALERARWLAERFPLLAGSWVELAEVESSIPDLSAAARSLEHALQVNPTWSSPARKLGLLLEELGELDRARSVLERATVFDPLEARNHGCLASILHKLGDTEGALSRIERAVRLDPAYAWAWEHLDRWSRDQDKAGRAREIARSLTVERPGDPGVWLRLADQMGEGEKEARIEALDQAIRLDPRDPDAHDSKATCLADVGRHDEALVVCEGPHWQGRPPLSLRGRAAWVIASKGQVEEAIHRMRVVVGEDPSYFWGWQQLADWHERQGDTRGNLEASEKLVELRPQDAISRGYLGAARLGAGDREGARTEFRKAVALDNSYAFGAEKLLGLALDAGHLAEAEALLARSGSHLTARRLEGFELRLALARGNEEAALRALGGILSSWSEGSGLPPGFELLRSTPQEEELLGFLERHITGKNLPPSTGAAWVQLAAQHSWKRADRVASLLQKTPGPAASSGLVRYLSLLAEYKRRKKLRRVLFWHRRRLRRDDGLWHAAGAGLARVGLPDEAFRWFGDWRRRRFLSPSDLRTPALLAWLLGRFSAHRDLREHALSLSPDESTIEHTLWLAFEEARAGRRACVRELLSRVESGPLTYAEKFLRAQVELLVDDRPEMARLSDWELTPALMLEYDDHAGLRQAHWLCHYLCQGRRGRLRSLWRLVRGRESWLRPGDRLTLLNRQLFTRPGTHGPRRRFFRSGSSLSDGAGSRERAT